MVRAEEPQTAGRTRLSQVRDHLTDPMYRTGYLLMASTLASAALGFGFWTVAARLYPAHDVGVGSSALAAMTFVSGICQLGLPAFMTRFVPSAGRGTRDLVLGAYAAAIGASLLFGSVAAMTAPFWSPSLAFLGHDKWWALGFVGSVVGWTIFTLQDSVMASLRGAHIVPIENTIYAFVKVALLAALAGVAAFSGTFIAWNAPTPFGVAIVSWIVFRRLIPRAEARAAETGIVELIPTRGIVLRGVGASLTGSIFLQVAWFLTPVIVTDLVGPVQEAHFYAPWTILVALNALTANTMTALTIAGAEEEGALFSLARRSLLNSWALLVIPIIVLVAGAPYILKIYGGTYAQDGTTLMRLLALSLFPSAVTSVAMAVVRIQHRNAWLIFIQAVPSIIQVGLTVWMVKTGGIAGAGWAQLIADGFGAVIVGFTVLRPLLTAGRGHAPAHSEAGGAAQLTEEAALTGAGLIAGSPLPLGAPGSLGAPVSPIVASFNGSLSPAERVRLEEALRLAETMRNAEFERLYGVSGSHGGSAGNERGVSGLTPVNGNGLTSLEAEDLIPVSGNGHSNGSAHGNGAGSTHGGPPMNGGASTSEEAQVSGESARNEAGTEVPPIQSSRRLRRLRPAAARPAPTAIPEPDDELTLTERQAEMMRRAELIRQQLTAGPAAADAPAPAPIPQTAPAVARSAPTPADAPAPATSAPMPTPRVSPAPVPEAVPVPMPPASSPRAVRPSVELSEPVIERLEAARRTREQLEAEAARRAEAARGADEVEAQALEALTSARLIEAEAEAHAEAARQAAWEAARRSDEAREAEAAQAEAARRAALARRAATDAERRADAARQAEATEAEAARLAEAEQLAVAAQIAEAEATHQAELAHLAELARQAEVARAAYEERLAEVARENQAARERAARMAGAGARARQPYRWSGR